MDNKEFVKVMKNSFDKYLETGSRSNEKLKILHGAIAEDIAEKLGEDYKIHSLGYRNGREVAMKGRYMDKKVDIAIKHKKDVIAAIGLKFIMRNYSQNSNNYFENMLGETANIRSNDKPYFQIFLVPSKVPYFNKEGIIKKYDIITEHNLDKYIKLSEDNPKNYMHTPDKTLVYLLDFTKMPTEEIKDIDSYIEYYQKNTDITFIECKQSYKFGSSVIYNDYETFIDKVYHHIKSL